MNKKSLETILKFMYKYKIKIFRDKLNLKLDIINNKNICNVQSAKEIEE